LTRALLHVAAVGNTLLVLPACLGIAFGLAALLGIRDGDAEWVAFGLGLLAPCLLGLSFLPGYLRAARGKAPAADPWRFWVLSASYNALFLVGLLALSIETAEPGDPVSLRDVGAALWASYMGALSMRMASEARRMTPSSTVASARGV
jgi:hypothetical protein